MAEIIACPSCQRRLQLPEDYDGQEVQCPGCGRQFVATSALPMALLVPQPAEATAIQDQAPCPPKDNFDELPRRRRRRQRPRPEQPQPRKSRGLWLGIIVLLGIVVWLIYQGRQPQGHWPEQRFRPLAEEGPQRRQEIAEAFRQQKPLAPQEIAKELQPLFQELGEAFRAHDAQRLTALFELERLLEELEAQKVLPPQVLLGRKDFLRGMQQGLSKGLLEGAPLMAFKAFEIRNIKKLAGNEAIVIVRHHDGGIRLKMRWWVTKRQGKWQVFDFEDLEVGLRTSTIMGVLLAGGLGQVQQGAGAVGHLRETFLALNLNNDPDEAEKKLQLLDGLKLPPTLEGVRLLAASLIRLQRGQFLEALDQLDKIAQFVPDMPAVDLLRGLAYNKLSRWSQALKHLEAYRDLLGDDDLVCLELGDALLGVGRLPEAAAMLRKSLDYEPNNLDAFVLLVRALGPEDARRDLPARLTKLNNPAEAFHLCVEDCIRFRNGEALEQLARAMRQIEPGEPEVDYALAHVKVWARQAGQARPFILAALDKEKNRLRRDDYLKGFCRLMVNEDQALAAYALLPDSQEAFQHLAPQLLSGPYPEDLRPLLARHRQKHPDAPLLPFFEGELHAREGNYQQAEQAFAQGLKRAPDPRTLEQFRPQRVLTRYYLGRGLSALADIGPANDTFQQLAYLCLQAKDYPQLQDLIVLHAKSNPDDPGLDRFRLRLLLGQNKVAEAMALFQKNLARMKQPDEVHAATDTFLLAMVDADKPLEGYQAVGQKAFPILAGDLLDQGKMTDLGRLVTLHRQRHPDDPLGCFYQGEVLLADQAWEQAARVMETGWGKAPQDLREQFRYLYVLAQYRAGRWLACYQAHPTKEIFTQLAQLLANDKKGPELEALLQAQPKPNAGEDPERFFAAARAKVFLQQTEAALALFRTAYEKQAESHRRKNYVNIFVLDLLDLDQCLEAYRLVADRKETFRILATELVFQKKTQELTQLLQEHGLKYPDDPDLWFYRGEWHLLQDQAGQAEQTFATALAKSKRDLWNHRDGLNRARIKAGKAVMTYRDAGPSRRTFETLAHLCVAAKDARQLQDLITAHWQAHPEDHNKARWEVEVKWLTKDYQGALDLLTGPQGEIMRKPPRNWVFQGYLVRSLLQLKRTKEAIAAAEKMVKDKQGDHLLLILAYAASGDVHKTMAVLQEMRSYDHVIADCYRDPDLGPILGSEPFRPFREKYPPPKEKVILGPGT